MDPLSLPARFDQDLKWPQSYSYFKETFVGRRTRNFTIAITVTILDLAVVYHDGPVIWQVWGVFPWLRIALLLLAGVGAFTLADMWSRTLSGAGTHLLLGKESDGSKTIVSLRKEVLGGG
jgi:hypothetical protein